MLTAATLSASARDLLLQTEWHSFKERFARRYETEEEEAHRYGVFAGNLERAAQLNRRHATGVFGVTKFADWTEDEVRERLLTYTPPAQRATSGVPVFSRGAAAATATPTSWDWRDEGVVTPVKNQGGCGSCWAFSATETIESAWAIAGNDLLELSPQPIVSCDTGAYGCGGGWTESAFDYVASAGGLPTEAAYPYTSGKVPYADGTCQSFTPAGGAVKSYAYATAPCTSVRCNSQDEDTMAAALAALQPLAICVDASSWSSYTGGIFPASACSSSYLKQDHCVQAVGFQQGSYWLVRNSWDTDWGEDGYIRLEYGSNACGVADDATYVLF